MANIEKILEELNKYYVYNPEEEQEEAKFGRTIYRNKYNGKDLRNMFMGTLNYPTNNLKDFVDSLRKAIDKMPDEWVAEFLKVQNGDVTEPVTESLKENLTADDFIKARKDTAVFPVSFKLPFEEEISIMAIAGHKEGTVEFSFDYTGENGYKIKNNTNLKDFPFDSVEDALKEAAKGIKEYYDVKTIKIGEPELR